MIDSPIVCQGLESHQIAFNKTRIESRGNVIYKRMNPFSLESYEKVTTPAKCCKVYCHCAFAHQDLEEVPSKLSPIFCFCRADLYRQLWEGIVGQPVKIKYVETLLRSNNQCSFGITLPLELAEECSPK
jgi:hypothetical protein